VGNGEKALLKLNAMRKVKVTTIIQTTPKQVIKAFTEPGMLKNWWGENER